MTQRRRCRCNGAKRRNMSRCAPFAHYVYMYIYSYVNIYIHTYVVHMPLHGTHQFRKNTLFQRHGITKACDDTLHSERECPDRAAVTQLYNSSR